MALINYLSKEALAESGTTLEGLTAIQKDFEQKVASYELVAQGITNVLLKTPGVHSGRYRVKNPTHLLEKVARKRHADKERLITLDNYEQEITDLAGVRVLHLFKGDWQRIHKFITDTWTLHEKPTAYYREGDSAEVLAMFTEHDCAVKQHPAGYRSVHYIVETSLTKARRLVEIQVRTIFEEGWSEVDHKLRYPNFSDNPLANNLLMILNRLAGSADEMSSFVQELLEYLTHSRSEVERLKQEHEEQVKDLQAVIDSANISAKQRATLEGVAKVLSEDKTLQDIQKLERAVRAIFQPHLHTTPMTLGNRPVGLLGDRISDEEAYSRLQNPLRHLDLSAQPSQIVESSARPNSEG
jgi:putative GTP pyrophosphokinase